MGEHAVDCRTAKARSEREQRAGGSDCSRQAGCAGAPGAKPFRAEGLWTGGARERAAAAGATPAGERGRCGDADRVREPLEFAAGARSGAAKGDRDSRGTGGGKGPVDWANVDGKPGAVVLWS